MSDCVNAAVAPVIDYEPPAFGGPPTLPPVPAPPSRSAAPPRPAPRTAADAVPAGAAAAFADAALRRVLEVIDRRRPLAQLRPLLAAGIVDSLPAPVGCAAPARLRRVVAQLAEPRRPDDREVGQPASRTVEQAAEVAAIYTRGTRLHAIACRVEQLVTPAGLRWQLVALHLG